MVASVPLSVETARVEPSSLRSRMFRRRAWYSVQFGGGGELAVAALGRDPRLGVELAGCGGAEIAGGGVDDAVRHLDLGEHLLLHAQQVLVLLVGVLLLGVDEHLHLVELVHADDAGGVLACCAGFTAVAGAPAAVAQRAVLKVQDLFSCMPASATSEVPTKYWSSGSRRR